MPRPDRLQDAIAKLQARSDLAAAKHRLANERHRADVAYVQQHHPEVAAFLTEPMQAFGRGEVDYRVVLREVEE